MKNSPNSYEQWKQTITKTSHKSNSYWTNFYTFAHLIYDDISFNTQQVVSNQLHLPQQRLSALTSLLREIKISRQHLDNSKDNLNLTQNNNSLDKR